MNIPEGRAVYEGGNWKNEFFITDHLGNTRVTFEGVNGYLTAKDYFDIDPYGVPLQAINQSSYNAVNINFKMQGKEEFGFGLNGLRDFGARFSDATIGGIWNAVDPLAELFPSVSPMAYCSNNPINRIDPDGNMDFGVNDWLKMKDGSVKFDAAINNQAQATAKYGAGTTDLGASATLMSNAGNQLSLNANGTASNATMLNEVTVKGKENNGSPFANIINGFDMSNDANATVFSVAESY